MRPRRLQDAVAAELAAAIAVAAPLGEAWHRCRPDDPDVLPRIAVQPSSHSFLGHYGRAASAAAPESPSKHGIGVNDGHHLAAAKPDPAVEDQPDLVGGPFADHGVASLSALPHDFFHRWDFAADGGGGAADTALPARTTGRTARAAGGDRRASVLFTSAVARLALGSCRYSLTPCTGPGGVFATTAPCKIMDMMLRDLEA